MISRGTKVLLLAAIFAMAGISSADSSATGHATNLAILHLQINQTTTQLLQPDVSITLTDLRALSELAQKYFADRKKVEWPLFNQRLEDQSFHRYQENSSYRESQSFLEQTLFAVFERYIATHPNPSDKDVSLTQLRDLLRQLQSFDDRHLSGSVWLYNSPLPTFAAHQLIRQSLEKQLGNRNSGE